MKEKRLTLSEIQPKMRVAYVKKYVEWDESPFLYGTVSSKNEKYAFVKFDQDVAKFGFDDAPAIPYNPNDLIAA